MPEKCPLGSGIYWANDNPDHGQGFPEVCRAQCEPLWDKALTDKPDKTDIFTEDCYESSPCNHGIEADDYSLQRGGGSKRGYAVLNVCSNTRTELFADEYSFDCPNN
jgi:hypothetical protein